MKLDNNQQQAVCDNSREILVLAGAGSGKTRVLTHRVSHLINGGVSGSSILLLTFTNKAAREMKERILQLVSELEAEKIWIGTFHATCLRILDDYGELIGHKKRITVYDDNDRRDIVRVLIDDCCLKISVNEGLSALDRYYSGEMFENGDDISILVSCYVSFLKKHNSLDFGMIVHETLRLFAENKHVQEHYIGKFTHVFVDEFQDTDATQWQFIGMLRQAEDHLRSSLFCVGDIDQSIYSWRCSKPEYTINFKTTFPDSKIIILDKNYRSTMPIVDASNLIISVNERTHEKKVIATKDGKKVVVMELENEEVAVLVEKLILQGYKYGDIAILARNNFVLDSFENSIKIPIQRPGSSVKIFKNFAVRQFVRIMKLYINPLDNFSCRMILNWPCNRFSEAEIARKELQAVEENKGLLQVIIESEESIFSEMKDTPTTEMFSIFAGEKYQNDVKLLTDFIAKWVKKTTPVTVAIFLRYLSIKDMQDDIESDNNKVTLTTMHGAKGLEWPVVIIVGAEKGTLPSRRGDREEERRLMYVAMTRAEKELCITYAKSRKMYGGKGRLVEKSEYINELLGSSFVENVVSKTDDEDFEI